MKRAPGAKPVADTKGFVVRRARFYGCEVPVQSVGINHVQHLISTSLNYLQGTFAIFLASALSTETS
jgi:hypothetical protein